MRIALIVIGLCILVGIYVYHQWRSSQVVEKIFSEDVQSEDVLLNDEQVQDVGDSAAQQGGYEKRAEPLLSSAFKADDTLQEPLDKDDPRFLDLQATQEVTPVHQYEALDSSDDDQDLIVLHLLAPEQQPFRGQSVLKALQAHKMRFGEFNIYHRIMEDEGQPESVFSIANMVKPGVLSPVELPQMQLQGLTFFLRLPAIVEDTVAFDDMMHVAQEMASLLSGSLNDQSFSELSAEKISQLRSTLV